METVEGIRLRETYGAVCRFEICSVPVDSLLSHEAIGVLRKHGVDLIFRFGSRVSGSPRPDSDMDIGVVFENEKDRLKNAVEVFGDLSDLFQGIYRGKKIDIVYLREGSYAFQYRVISEGELLYAASPAAHADYREEVMRRYFDFKPVESLFDQVFLEQGT